MAITATSSKQALVDLINKDNNTTFKLSDLVLAAPATANGKGATDALNTTVAVTGADADKLPGSVTVTYTRPSVKVLLALSSWRAPAGTSATVEGITAAVKSGLIEDGIKSVPLEDGSYEITVSQMAEGDADYNADYPWKVTVDFSKHYVLGDTLPLTVGIAAATLDDQVKTTELSGFSNDDVKPAQQG